MLRDELNVPLGCDPNLQASAPSARDGAVVLVLLGALIAGAVALDEASLLRGVALGTARADASASHERQAASAELPPLRLTASLDAPASPVPTAHIADKDAATPARPTRARPGAPEPLIIHVQQALAALHAKDAPAPSR